MYFVGVETSRVSLIYDHNATISGSPCHDDLPNIPQTKKQRVLQLLFLLSYCYHLVAAAAAAAAAGAAGVVVVVVVVVHY